MQSTAQYQKRGFYIDSPKTKNNKSAGDQALYITEHKSQAGNGLPGQDASRECRRFEGRFNPARTSRALGQRERKVIT